MKKMADPGIRLDDSDDKKERQVHKTMLTSIVKHLHLLIPYASDIVTCGDAYLNNIMIFICSLAKDCSLRHTFLQCIFNVSIFHIHNSYCICFQVQLLEYTNHWNKRTICFNCEGGCGWDLHNS